jgi:hypothetical protein
MLWRGWPSLTLGVLLLAGCFTEKPTVIYATVAPPPRYHIHLPGIGGYRSIDRGMLRGLQEGGFDAQFEPYDWTGDDTGLAALLATKRHVSESAHVCTLITEAYRAHPDSKLTITCHSGGAGIVTWALEQSAPDVMVDDMIFLSSALSPKYDLSKALKHVRGHVYVIYSPYDIAVLGVGTNMFGTIDGVKTDASGKVGFAKPEGADETQYKKLVQIRYDSGWVRLGNIGDHIGSMSRPFAREVLAPLLLRGELPKLPAQEELKVPATLPAGAGPTPPGAASTTQPALSAPAR